MPSRLHRSAWLLPVGVMLAAIAACNGKQPTSPAGPTAAGPVTPAAPVIERPSRGPIAFISDRDGATAIYLANRDGSGVTRLTSGEQPAWAPGGRQLAFHRAGGIYVISADGSGEARVTAGFNPAWSPDGKRLVFNTPAEDGSIEIVNVDGSGSQRLVDPAIWNTRNGPVYGAYWPSWSPDGRSIAFIRASYDDSWALFVVNVDGAITPRLLVRGTSENTAWSPDGSQIAFGAGPGRVGVADANGSGWTLAASGFNAAWTPTGALILNRFTGPGTAENPVGSRMRIFVSTSLTPLIAEAAAPVRPDYWDQQAIWAR